MRQSNWKSCLPKISEAFMFRRRNSKSTRQVAHKNHPWLEKKKSPRPQQELARNEGQAAQASSQCKQPLLDRREEIHVHVTTSGFELSLRASSSPAYLDVSLRCIYPVVPAVPSRKGETPPLPNLSHASAARFARRPANCSFGGDETRIPPAVHRRCRAVPPSFSS